MTTWTWSVEYEFEGKTYSTLADTACNRSPVEMMIEFEARHGVKATRAHVSFTSEEKPMRGLAGNYLPHQPSESKPFVAEQLDLI